MLKNAGRPLLLRGKVVQPDGSAPDRYVLVRGGRVQQWRRERSKRPDPS